jgi:hypothetical protein
MNDTPAPLEPDQLDELLSAELDGEFDAAARDLGLRGDEAVARLQATPGVEDRRRALAAASGALGEVPEIDELLAARLRAKAVRSLEEADARRADDRARRRNRLLVSAGGVAAALLAIVALAAGLGTHSSSSSNSKASSASSGADTSTLAPRRDVAGTGAAASALGAFTDAHALAVAAVDHGAFKNGSALLTKPAASPSAQYGQSQTSLKVTLGPSGGHRVTAGGADAAPTTTGAVKSTATDTLAGCGVPAGVPVTGNPLSRSTATLSGKPVLVFVFAGRGEHVVVIENADCTLSTVLTLN